MRVIILISLFILGSCYFSFAQTDTTLVKGFMSSFISNFAKNKTLTVVDEPYFSMSIIEEFKKSSRAKTILSEIQINELYNDMLAKKAFIWTTNLITGAKFISSKTYDSLTSTINIKTLSKFSRPSFTKNQIYCLIYYNWKCGPMCGGYALSLYKKENNSWVFNTQFIHSEE